MSINYNRLIIKHYFNKNKLNKSKINAHIMNFHAKCSFIECEVGVLRKQIKIKSCNQ